MSLPGEEPSVFIDESHCYTFRPKAFQACEERYKVKGNVQKNLQSAVEVLEFSLFVSLWEFRRDNRKVAYLAGSSSRSLAVYNQR